MHNPNSHAIAACYANRQAVQSELSHLASTEAYGASLLARFSALPVEPYQFVSDGEHGSFKAPVFGTFIENAGRAYYLGLGTLAAAAVADDLQSTYERAAVLALHDLCQSYGAPDARQSPRNVAAWRMLGDVLEQLTASVQRGQRRWLGLDELVTRPVLRLVRPTSDTQG